MHKSSPSFYKGGLKTRTCTNHRRPERPKYSKYMTFYTQNGALITLRTMAIWLGYTDNCKGINLM